MLRRIGRSKRTGFFVDADCHPQTIAVVTTRAEPLGIELTIGDPSSLLASADAYFGVLLAQPGSTGALVDLGPIIEAVHAAEGLVSVTTDLLACCLITPPGELGADIVVGSAQRFGVPMGFGGPHAGFMACRQAHARSLPGRLVGVSIDSAGKPAYRLALQTREQHIRREKATSNICTAQALLANVSAAYAAWHGPEGLTAIAKRTHGLASALAAGLEELGFSVTESFFDTITVRAPGAADGFVKAARAKRINIRSIDADHLSISFDETSTIELVGQLLATFSGLSTAAPALVHNAVSNIPDELRRTSSFLTHHNFHNYRSEHEMLRWLRRLSDRDLALDRTMIPLGSCTMKLNAAAEMEPISWSEFANVHPFAPSDQTAGYRQLIGEVENTLAEITGYHQVSLQPNAGSQGEYAGLLAIRAWQAARGEANRDVCLIPASAHGTNAASAVLAGMVVVVVACDDAGNIDIADLAAKIDKHGTDLAALMMTYPSTHGVYEATVGEVCRMIHDAGGQVYTDGANLNALVGIARPGRFGSDVSHLNLHKTFCIPHGGGGPGVGPVAVGEHLAPYLPGHPVVPDAVAGESGAVSAAISWMYMPECMGAGGPPVEPTEGAVLSAKLPSPTGSRTTIR
ncbi:UNVERIFIED_CONTAM: hypothetical protein GTU68_063707 [Idotea baltica]|nr:hypothetical protein [Idotea baltica]